MAGKSSRSILRSVLLPLVTLLVCGAILGIHAYGRQRELNHVGAFYRESVRRDLVRYLLDDAMIQAQEFRSPAFFRKFFADFGTVTSTPIPEAHRGWHVQIHNNAFGDEIDMKLLDHGSDAEIEFSQTITLHTTSWLIFTGVAWWTTLLVPVLLFGGLIAFFLPRPLRKWGVMLAAVALTTSLISTSDNVPARFNIRSTAPAASFAFCCLAMIWPRRKIDPIKCRKCGYDLTGNVSGVCPECGTPRRLHNLDALASNLDNIT